MTPQDVDSPERRRRSAALALLGLALLALPAVVAPRTAQAHARSQSFSTWEVRGADATAVFSVAAVEATRLVAQPADAGALDRLLRDHLAERVRVARAGTACSAGAPRTLAARPGLLRVELRFACGPDGPLAIANGAFFDLVPSHLHTARVRIGDEPGLELVFTDALRERVLGAGAAGPEPGTSFGRWVQLGVAHIAGGADHVAFLVALLLLCRRWRDVAWLVTGFTAGHSLTLSLAALGLVRPNVPVVESLIGFTIALVAAENVATRAPAGPRPRRALAICAAAGLVALAALRWRWGVGLPVATSLGLALFSAAWIPLATSPADTVRWRPAVTLVFGLVHGFGFAHVLLEIGLPTDRLLRALVGFNLGVELGQLAIVAALAAAGSLFARRFAGTPAPRVAVDLASAALCGLGLYWFVERALGA